MRKWRLSDAKDLAAALNSEKILNDLRDGLPFPYAGQDDAGQEVSVPSSPCAAEGYRHPGFEPTDREQVTDGLRIRP